MTKDIVQNEMKEHLKNATPKVDQSVINSHLKEINILKEELSKQEALIKELNITIRNLTTDRLKQQPIQSQIITSESDENYHISTARPVNDKESNLDNTNMNTSTVNDYLGDQSTYIVPKKATIIQCWSNKRR